jgi:hypothetical protein
MRKKEYDLFRLQVRSDDKLVAAFYGAEDDERHAPREVPARLGMNDDARLVIKLLNDRLSDASIKADDLEKLGERLYGALFPDKIGAMFEEKWQKAKDEGRGLRLSITVEEGSEVLSWPLEFLKGPKYISWLASRRDLTLSRRVTFEQDFKPGQPAKRPLRVLIVVSKPEGLGGVMTAKVIEQISDWAAEEENKGSGGEAPIQITVLGILDDYEQEIPEVDYLGERATFKNFRRYTDKIRPHILHFIGHGEIQEGKGHLALINEDDELAKWLSSSELAEMVIDFNPRLVVLQACQTAHKDTARQTHSGFLSMAEYLVRNWIPAVVAMQFEIQNDYAIEFATGFYEALSQGLEVDAAVQEGRSNIVDLYQWKERYFGAPVLFMDSPYVIIEGIEEGAASPKPDRIIPDTAKLVFPDIEMLALEDLDFVRKAVKGSNWDLAVAMLERALKTIVSASMDPGRTILLQDSLGRSSNRIAAANQAALDEDHAQVDTLVNWILEDLDVCIKAIQFGGAPRGAASLQAPPDTALPGRGSPTGGRTAGGRDSFSTDRPKAAT